MKTMKIYIGSCIFLFSCFIQFNSFAETSDGSGFKEQRQKFYEQMKSSGKKDKFSAQEKQVMKQAADALAKELPDPGLKVGAKAPEINLKNAFGKKISLYAELKKGPVILVFYRGAWCPFCNLHLHVLQKNIPNFKKYNAQLIAVTPQKPDKSAGQIKKDKFPFEVLSDTDSQVMKAYNLYYELNDELVKVYKKHDLDVEAFNGKGRNVLPVPGTFVINGKGIIRGAHAETDYKERMEPEEILNILKDL